MGEGFYPILWHSPSSYRRRGGAAVPFQPASTPAFCLFLPILCVCRPSVHPSALGRQLGDVVVEYRIIYLYAADHAVK